MLRNVTCGCVILLAVGSAYGQSVELPVGSVVAWLKSYDNAPPLSDGWVECNGQVLEDANSPFNGQTIPDLNNTGRFLRGSTVSGTLQDDEFRSHVHPPSGGIYFNVWASGGGNCGQDYCQTLQMELASQTGAAGGTETRPVNMSVVWIMKVRSLPGGVPAVSTWGLLILGILVLTGGSLLIARRRVALA